jgi:alkylation response protein AidB-like acyl-CoA dehydrogenase
MEFTWSAEQLELRDAVVAFARAELADDVVRRDQDAEFSREAWSKCGEMGVQGLPFPTEFGGGGQDALTTVFAMEGLGYACRDNGLLFGLNAQMWSVQMPILRHGGDDLCRRYLPRLCSGQAIGAHGMSEPDSGSDAFTMRTTARREGDVYVLNGVKTFVSEGPVADVFLVFAATDRAKGFLGITGFLVDRDTPGLRIGKVIHKMGLRTSPMCELVLDDCRVAVANRLGREGRGAQIFNDSMEWERCCIMAGFLGTMQRQLEDAVRYAKTRTQFGKAIFEYQAVSHRLAQMRMRLEAARLLVYRGTWLKQHGRPASAETAMAKLFLSEAFVQSSLDAIQTLGGYGYTVEYQAERDLRDAIGGRLYSGTSEIQHNLIARSLGT